MLIIGFVVVFGFLVDVVIVMIDVIWCCLLDGVGVCEVVGVFVKCLWLFLLSLIFMIVFGFVFIILLFGGVGEFVGLIVISVIIVLIVLFLFVVLFGVVMSGFFLLRVFGGYGWIMGKKVLFWVGGILVFGLGWVFEKVLFGSLKVLWVFMIVVGVLLVIGFIGVMIFFI